MLFMLKLKLNTFIILSGLIEEDIIIPYGRAVIFFICFSCALVLAIS